MSWRCEGDTDRRTQVIASSLLSFVPNLYSCSGGRGVSPNQSYTVSRSFNKMAVSLANFCPCLQHDEANREYQPLGDVEEMNRIENESMNRVCGHESEEVERENA